MDVIEVISVTLPLDGIEPLAAEARREGFSFAVDGADATYVPRLIGRPSDR